MKKYPENTPKVFIDFVESDMALGFKLSGEELSLKEIAELFIFDSRLQKISTALAKRLDCSDTGVVNTFTLMYVINRAMNGPDSWQGMTPKEQENKIEKIKRASAELANDINETPMNKSIRDLILCDTQGKNFEKAFSFLVNEVRQRDKLEGEYAKNIECVFFALINIAGMKVGEMLRNLSTIQPELSEDNCMKRRVNVNRLFFIREVSGYFKRRFGSYLYNITSVISTVILNDNVSIEDVRSAVRK